eukprot:10239423-Karenia_brevis.AAC.1
MFIRSILTRNASRFLCPTGHSILERKNDFLRDARLDDSIKVMHGRARREGGVGSHRGKAGLENAWINTFVQPGSPTSTIGNAINPRRTLA